jgi:hypothetical protein
MQNEIAVEGDAGQIVAGNATHDGATTNTHMSNVITIHPPDNTASVASPNRGAHCAASPNVAQQFKHIRIGLSAACTLATVAIGMAAYALIAPETAPGTCHHESRTHSPGGIARMDDGQFYVCTMARSTSAAQWELSSTVSERGVTFQSPEPRSP